MSQHAELSGLVYGAVYRLQGRRPYIRKIIGHFYIAMPQSALSSSEELVLKKINHREHLQSGNAFEKHFNCLLGTSTHFTIQIKYFSTKRYTDTIEFWMEESFLAFSLVIASLLCVQILNCLRAVSMDIWSQATPFYVWLSVWCAMCCLLQKPFMLPVFFSSCRCTIWVHLFRWKNAGTDIVLWGGSGKAPLSILATTSKHMCNSFITCLLLYLFLEINVKSYFIPLQEETFSSF